MSDDVFEVNNKLPRSNSEKFYLNPTMADVKFVFGTGTGQVECVTAHKIILSIGSSVFYTMFFGSKSKEGDIPIDGVSAAAFREFLQFFYLREMKLSTENIYGVIKLCKKYKLSEGLIICERILQKSLTIDEIVSGYAIALRFELKKTIGYCEHMINSHAKAILKSTSFLQCNRKTLDRIIKLVMRKKKGKSSGIGDACVAWAKARCGRKNLEENEANIKAQLGRSFAKIAHLVELH